MIGKSLNERFVLGLIHEERAVALLREVMPAQAAHLVEVRKQDPRMIAVLFVHADKQTVRVCKDLGLAIEPGATGVLGLLGDDAARLFPTLPDDERAWLQVPSSARETKVLLIAGGRALLSITTGGDQVTITPVVSRPS
jgi:hypothetical protein